MDLGQLGTEPGLLAASGL